MKGRDGWKGEKEEGGGRRDEGMTNGDGKEIVKYIVPSVQQTTKIEIDFLEGSI